MLSLDQINVLARRPHSFVISCNMGLNLDRLKDEMWDKLQLVRVYTKKKGERNLILEENRDCCNYAERIFI
jgi:uncharacterized protein